MSKQKINPVRGMHDILPNALSQFHTISETARNIAQLYGFQYIQTPIMEFSEVFKRSLGDSSDVVNKEMYIFHDKKGEEIVLRPENTASIVRAFISNGLQDKLPARFFYNGPMFRYERPQKGRQRQFHQIGVEILGAPQPLADIDTIACAYQILCQLGLQNKITLQINSLGDSQSRENYRSKLVKYLNQHENKLSQDSQQRLKNNPLRILDSKDENDQQIIKNAPQLSNHLNQLSQQWLETICQNLNTLKIPYSINPYLVRGLDYYCHTVFEFISDELGAQATVLAGGRYDGLVKALGGQDISGCGWAAGIERLALLTKQQPQTITDIALIPIGDNAEEKIMKLAYQLRQQGFITDYLYAGSTKKHLNNANQKQAKIAIIIGDDELNNKTFTIKNMNNGEEFKLSAPYNIPPLPNDLIAQHKCDTIQKILTQFYAS